MNARLDLPIFQFKSVTQTFGQIPALININLQIYPGERVALIGSSGAGKSTLLQLLNGTIPPSQGEIWAIGSNLSQLSPRRLRQVQRQIGTIYQQLHLVDSLRVIHNVNAGHLGRWPLWKAALSLMYPLEVETALKALKQVGIPEKIYTSTGELSGGQQQRVAIARVLVQNPVAILADEPISSLDPALSQEILALLREISQREGKTLVVSLHLPELARKYCDRLLGLRQGQVLFDVASTDISQQMLDELYRF